VQLYGNSGRKILQRLRGRHGKRETLSLVQ